MSSPPKTAKQIFVEAIEGHSPEQWPAFLDQACGDDAQLRHRVEILLEAHVEDGSLLDNPAFGPTNVLDQPHAEKLGMAIGPYKLLEQIGEGGFGIVYMADQQAPVRRRVALKIIKPGMDTKNVLTRFEAERQALALMDHPNIARAIDAGATDSGRPYFVMELVKGIPITDYCDQNNLAVHERLDLFVTVCHAVQHAHQKGIIHRDIKPSNVLVTMQDGRPVPKVIDFGVAKAINQQLTQETIFTRFAEMIGTPLYMSPEQAEMTSLDIDTRSDIYSLGVMLYELLTGTTPFEKDRLKQAALDEIRRIIREEEPAKPSTRISTLGDKSALVAAHRHADSRRLGQLMRGDLDWIVMKALEKDRTRRYETANGLAMDIQRHLADEPVLAGPPSTWYRFHKFARRNRTPLAMAAVVTIALLLGIVGTTWQAIRATRERAQAEANLQKARQAVDEYFTLVSDSKLLDVPGLQPLRKQLLESALRYYQGFSHQKTDDPQLLADLASTYLRVAVIDIDIDRNDDAVGALEQGLAIVERLRQQYPAATEQHRLLAGFWKGVRNTKVSTELPTDPQKADRVLEKFAEHWEAFVRENPAVTGFQSDLFGFYALRADMLFYLGRRDDSLLVMQKAREIGERLVRENPSVAEHRIALAMSYDHLAKGLRGAGKTQEADKLVSQGIALMQQVVSDPASVPQHRLEFARNLHFQGDRLLRKGDVPQAEKNYRQALEIFQKLVDESPDVPLHLQRLSGTQSALAKLLQDTGRLEEAERLMRKALELRTKLATEFVQENPRLYFNEFGVSVIELANLLQRSGHVADAKIVWESGIDLLNIQLDARNSGPSGLKGDRVTLFNYLELATLFELAGQPQEAAKAFRQGISLIENLGADHPDSRKAREMLDQSYQSLARVLAAAGRAEEAKQAYRQGADQMAKLASEFPDVASYREAVGHQRRLLAFTMSNTAEAQDKEAAFREAVTIFGQLATQSPKEPNYRHWLADTHRALGELFAANKRDDESESAYRQSVDIYQTLAAEFPDYRWHLAGSREALAGFLSGTGRKADAETAYRDAHALWEKLVAESPTNRDYRWHLAVNHDLFGQLLKDVGRHQEAAEAFHHALPLWEKLSAETHSDDHRMHLSWTRGWLIDVLLRQGEHAEVAKLAIEVARASPDKSESLRAAVYLDQCAALAQKDASLTPADRKAASDASSKQAAELISEAGKRVAGNGQLENQLAWGLVTNPKPELRVPARAVELAGKAVELAPTAGYIWNTLGVAQYRAGDWKAAIAALEKSMELRQGGDSGDWFFVAMAHWQLGEKGLAQKWYKAAALWMAQRSPNNDEYKQFRAEAATLLGLSETEPGDATDELALGEILVDVHPQPSSYLFRGSALANSNQWARAVDDYTKAIELGEKSYYPWYALALMRRVQDDKPAYQAACADLLKQFAQTNDAQTANFVAWTCALGPEATTDFVPAIALAEKAAASNAKSTQFANCLGAILYRAGRFDEARQKLEEADRLEMSADPRLSTPAYTWFFLAMTQHRLGHADEAKQWADKARQAMVKAMKEHEAGTSKLAWNRRLTLNLLRREAEQLVDFKTTPGEPAAVNTIESAAPVVAPKPRNVSTDN